VALVRHGATDNDLVGDDVTGATPLHRIRIVLQALADFVLHVRTLRDKVRATDGAAGATVDDTTVTDTVDDTTVDDDGGETVGVTDHSRGGDLLLCPLFEAVADLRRRVKQRQRRRQRQKQRQQIQQQQEEVSVDLQHLRRVLDSA
ncbi:MAG: hypothetical protein MHM6MM_009610, partial [Cercozoa sp. M6MM]